MAGSDKRKIQIQEGLSSYLDAMVTVNEFTRAIQNDCRSILDTKAAALGKAAGLKFNREGIYPSLNRINLVLRNGVVTTRRLRAQRLYR